MDGAPTSPPSTSLSDYELPAYNDCVEIEEDEPVMDENERIALQEEEDERLAREMFEAEQKRIQTEVCMSVYLCGCD